MATTTDTTTTECSDRGVVTISNCGVGAIITVCCDDGATDGSGAGDDPYQDETPMTSKDNLLEDGWVGDSLFQAKCCANESVQLRWFVEGDVVLYRDGIQIYAGPDKEFEDIFVVTEDVTYRLTGVNGVDKQITLSPTDCVACNAFTLKISCGPGAGELVGELIGVTGVEYVVFERDSTIVAEGFISGFVDIPGDGTFEYVAFIDGVPVTAPSVTMPDECEGEWSEWECLPSYSGRPFNSSYDKNNVEIYLPYVTEIEIESSNFTNVNTSASISSISETGVIRSLSPRIWDGTRLGFTDIYGLWIRNSSPDGAFTVCYRYLIIP